MLEWYTIQPLGRHTVNTSTRAGEPVKHVKAGDKGLFVLHGRRFFVGVLEVDENAIRVSFPKPDLLDEGARVELEVHNENGFNGYECEILRTPRAVGEGVLLSHPVPSSRNVHRSGWRVPAGLPGRLKGHVHPKAVQVDIVNLSVGGALVRAKDPMPLAVGDNADLRFSLPDAEEERLLTEVVHAEPESGKAHEVGLRFISTDQQTRRLLTNFVWRTLRELYPEDFSGARK